MRSRNKRNHKISLHLSTDIVYIGSELNKLINYACNLPITSALTSDRYKPKGNAMPLYETVFIARQDMTPAQVDELTAATAKIITDGQGKILKTDNWGLRTLAYKIKKNRKGYYVLFNMDAPADAMLEMERQIRLNEDVLRYMTIRVDEFIDETKTNHDEEREAA